MTVLGVFEKLYGAGAEMTLGRTLLISAVGFLLVFLILGLLALFVKAQGGVFDLLSRRKAEKLPLPASPAAPASPALPESESQGEIKLIGVTEEEAALVMAIVANETGADLNHLIFKSVRALEEEE